VKLSPEGMVCLSSGSDCTFKVWDLGTRMCIKTYGGDQPGVSRKHSNYHKDTINSMDVIFDQDIAFTGGRDGSIFQTKIIKN
jgi:WD40 repeat protein